MDNTCIKMMFGCHALHVPMNIVVQDMGDKVSLCIAQIAGKRIRFGSDKTHQLILGDAVIRPHAVLESDKFIGLGMSAVVTMDWRDWSDEKIILNPSGMDVQKILWGE